MMLFILYSVTLIDSLIGLLDEQWNMNTYKLSFLKKLIKLTELRPSILYDILHASADILSKYTFYASSVFWSPYSNNPSLYIVRTI